MGTEIMEGKNMEQWQSAEIKDLAMAIVAAQAMMKPAIKDSTNPFFKSKYADLSSVWTALQPFNASGIAITQHPMESPAGHITIDTQLTHNGTGQWMRSRLTMPVAKNDPQGFGSAITYARRYALGCMTGLVTEEDDDGNAASKPKYTICDAAIRQPAVAPAQDAPIIWNAGKPPHRGKNIREVDFEYLTWYEANGPQDEYRVKASQELDRRDLEQDMNRELPNG
jgi:hypothetical protein